MVLVNHVRQDISCLDNLCCLLPNTPRDVLLCKNEEAKLQGAYLYYDGNNENWIRSGKLTGECDRGFIDCNNEHHKEAEKDVSTS